MGRGKGDDRGLRGKGEEVRQGGERGWGATGRWSEQ